MKTIERQEIRQSLREGLGAYLNADLVSLYNEHFTQKATGGIYPTDEAIAYLKNWIECSYANDENEDKGTIEEWTNEAILEFIDFLELKSGDFDDQTMYEMIEEEMN